MRQTITSQPRALNEREPAVLALEPARRRVEIPTLVLTGPRSIIGSAVDADVRLTLDGIEPRHCSVEIVDGRVQIQALASRTWLNDSPTRRATLRVGDRLTLGPWEFRVRRATTELLQNVPGQHEPAAVVDVPPPPAPISALTLRPSPDSLQNLAREIGRERAVEQPKAEPVKDSSRLDSLLDGWDAEADALRRELLSQAKLLNEEIRGQQKDLEELRQQARHSAEALERERQNREQLEDRRASAEALKLQSREQELARQSSELERQKLSLAEQRADLDYLQKRQQAELSATATWWEQRREDLRRRQEQFAELSSLLQELHLDLMRQSQLHGERVRTLSESTEAFEARETELQRKEQHLEEWEKTLGVRDSTIATKLADAAQTATRLSTQSQELSDFERVLADRRSVIDGREIQLHERERDLATGQIELDRREADLQLQLDLLVERQQVQAEQERLQAARIQELSIREADFNSSEIVLRQFKQKLEDERAELDEDLSRAEKLRRQLLEDREQLVAERELLQEEQSRFRKECDEFASHVEALAAERLEFQKQREEVGAQAVLPVVDVLQVEAQRQANDAELQALRAQLDQTQSELAVARQRLASLERSLQEQSETLEEEREHLLADRMSLDTERQEILAQRQLANSEQQSLMAERDRMQSELQTLEESRGRLSAELDQIRARQQEMDTQFEHRHAEVTDWLQEHVDSQSQPFAESTPAPLADDHDQYHLLADEARLGTPYPQPADPYSASAEIAPPNEFSPPAFSSDFSSSPSAEAPPAAPRNYQDDFGQSLPTEGSWLREGELHTESSWSASPHTAENVDSVDSAQAAEEARVRSMLAEMFNMPLSPTEPPVHEVEPPSATAESIESLYRRADGLVASKNTRAESEPVEYPDRRQPASEIAQIEEEPAAEEPTPPAPVVQAPSSSDYSLESADPDSISAYMERLLQRNRRQGSSEHYGSSTPAARASTPLPTKAHETTVPVVQQPETDTVDSLGASGAEDAGSLDAELTPRPRLDVQEVRAGIDSLRQVANLSARTAVAKHTWRQTRSLIYLRAGMTLAAFGFGAFLLLGPLEDRQRFQTTGMAALVIGLISSADFLRTWWRVHSAEKLRRNSERSMAAQLPNRVAAATGVDDDFTSSGNTNTLHADSTSGQ